MLVKYREELTRPVEEAMEFMRRIEAQLNVLSNGRVSVFSTGTSISFSFHCFLSFFLSLFRETKWQIICASFAGYVLFMHSYAIRECFKLIKFDFFLNK